VAYAAEVTILCLIGVPRTGSTQVMRALSSFHDVTAYGEIFHPNKCYGLRGPFLDELRGRTEESFPADPGAPATIDFVRHHPRQVLDALAEAAGSGCAALKIFPNHLEPELMDTEVLGRDDVEPVFLRRRVIDSYVSGLKSKQANAWQYHDTTDITAVADIDGFVSWSRNQQRWYTRCVEAVAAAGKPMRLMTYEREIEPGIHATFAYLSTLLEQIGVSAAGDPQAVDSMPRQDRSSDLSEKVENWEDFERDLRSRDLSPLAMGYFIGGSEHAPSVPSPADRTGVRQQVSRAFRSATWASLRSAVGRRSSR
jgi:hypothetical protein